MKSNLLFLNSLHIFNDGYFGSIIVMLPFIASTLGLDLFQAGILGSLTGIVGILLAYQAGQASVRYGGIKILLFAMGIYAASFLLLSTVINFYTTFAVFLLAAFGFGIFHPIGFGLVSKFSERGKRGAQIGTFTALGDVGKIGVTALLTVLIAYIGWRNTSLLYGLLAFMFLIVFSLIHSKNPHINVSEKSKDLKISTLFKNKRFLLSATSGTLDVFASFPLFIFLPFLLLEKGFPTEILGALVGVFFIGNLLGKTVLGRSIDKYGHVKIFFMAEVLMAVFITLLALSNSLVLIIVFSVILGILTKGTVPVIQTMVSDAVEHHGNFEKSISAYSTIANISVALSPILLGIVSNNFGVTYAFFVSAGFALLAIIPALFIPFVKNEQPI